jgi:hypothetical protein
MQNPAVNPSAGSFARLLFERRVSGLLEEPWDTKEGRPRELTFREALVVTCGYMRENIIEDAWADIFNVAQSTTSTASLDRRSGGYWCGINDR